MPRQSNKRISLLQTTKAGLFRVLLELQGKRRVIGKLDNSGGGTFTSTKKTEKHLFRKGNALGINLELVQNYGFQWVVVPFSGRTLSTTREELLERGFVLSFKQSGYEPQVFLPLRLWGKGKPGGIEQSDLFGSAA